MSINKLAILTIVEPGSLVRKSGIFPTEVFEGGKFVGIADKFVSNALVGGSCKRELQLPESTVSYLTSTEGCPNSIPKRRWLMMPDKVRLSIQCKELAEGNPFTLKLI